MSTRWNWFLGIAPFGAIFWSANCAWGQITPDATLPNNSTVKLEGNTRIIEGGTKAGRNLFHSFEAFSVPTGSTAHFNNASDIQNIISRVTGKSISNIDGLISARGTANLFLMNPQGIIFGPNASLNIGGSFLATTASSFKFPDGSFGATPSLDQPLLTITAPVGLGLGSNPGEIKVLGPGHEIVYEDLYKGGSLPKIEQKFTGLQVKQGKTLALVGGNISLEGGVLTSIAGRIEIGSFGSNQFVNIVPVEQGFRLGNDGATNFRDIQFSGKAFVNTTGDGGGTIAIAGRNINFTSESILLNDTIGDKNSGKISIVGDSIVFNRSNIGSNTFSSGNAGSIKLDANNIKFENQASASIQTRNRGDAGNINLRANSLSIEGSSLASITQENSTGKAGDINIQVNGPLAIANTGIVTDTLGTGDAGKISISANSFQMKKSSVYSRVVNTGIAGEINVNVADSLAINNTYISTDTFGTGNAGKISISANSFRLEDSGVVSQTQENSTGRAGEININVAGSLELPKKAGIITTTYSKGDAGKINISANSFLLEQSAVKSNTEGSSTGSAGEININVAGLFKINSAGAQTNTLASGKAGDLNVQAKTLVLDNGTGLEVRSTGNSDAGNLRIVADTIKLDNQSSIFATTTSGNGGNIQLNVAKLLLLGGSSRISATAGTDNAGGNGGNITIKAPNGFIVGVSGGNSDITANAFTGSGGRVQINATGIYGIAPLSRLDLEKLRPDDLNPRQIPTNDITAISQQNPFLSGTVTINTPDVNPNRGLVQLPTNLVEATQQIDTSCNPGSRQLASSFVVTGRGGLPPSPYEILTPDAVLVDLVTLNRGSENRSTAFVTSTTTATPEPIVEATGWVRNAKGEVVLTANPPTATAYSSWPKPVSCQGS